MPDPWEAQRKQIQINQQRGAQRYEEQTGAGATVFKERQREEELQPRGPEPRDLPVPQAPYWAVVAYCQEHDKWGCAYKQRQLKDAYYEAHSAASRHGSEWCTQRKAIKNKAGLIFGPGYLMVRRNDAGKYGWDTGRYLRRIERKIRRRLGGDSELMLLVSVRRGVLVNNGLDLQVGWSRGMPGALN